MKLDAVFGFQMAPRTCSLVNRVCSIVILMALLFAAGFPGLGPLSVALTSMVLLLSTFLFTFYKLNSSEGMQNKVALEPKYESSTLCKEDNADEEEEGEDCNGEVDDSMAIRSPDSLFESECINTSTTSEDSEVDWPLDRTPDCSDGSISDEESLIEIAIPSGHYIVGCKEEPKHHKLYKKMPHFSPDSVFHGNSLIDLLGEIDEMNEEDNLIEIDISAGSVKCSRFGIKA